MTIDTINFCQELMKIPSVSGTDTKIIDFFKETVDKLGFKSEILTFSGDGGSYEVRNIHSIFNPNNSKNILYFAGHLDVVPEGDIKKWNFHPYESIINDGNLYGRGACDMKAAIGAFIGAVSEFLTENKNIDFGIGLLITGDEEAESINGTKKMLEWMSKNNHQITSCIVGEPTSSIRFGDIIKIGRRGSVNFNLKVNGKQGHVAYPENAINPISMTNDVLKILKDYNLDDGDEFFDPSNLEITSISSPNNGTNVIPAYCEANFNIRFNPKHSSKSLIELVEYVCSKSIINRDYELKTRISGESFISKNGLISQIASKAIKEEVGVTTKLSTSGGTSDARFIKNYCDDLVELGLINKTAHQVDENVKVDDIISLKNIYKSILNKYKI